MQLIHGIFVVTFRLSWSESMDIMRSLGHEKMETTMIYLQKVFAREQHAVNQWKPDVLDEF